MSSILIGTTLQNVVNYCISASYNSTGTILAPDVANGIITSNSGSNITLTLPSASALYKQMKSQGVNSYLTCMFNNIGAGQVSFANVDTNLITTNIASTVLASGDSAIFIFACTQLNPTQVTVYGGSPNVGPQESLIPSADATYDLGSTSFRWRNLFLSGSIGSSGSGGAITGIYLNPASGSTPTAQLTEYDEQKITNVSITGAFTATGTIYLRKIGKQAFMHVNTVQGTSSAASTLQFTLPSGYVPADSSGAQTVVWVEGPLNGAWQTGLCFINSSGVVAIGPTSAGASAPGNYSNSQTAVGFVEFDMTWATST